MVLSMIGLPFAAAPAALAQERLPPPLGSASAITFGQVVGMLVTPAPDAGPPIGVVVLLHDSLGPDARGAHYIDQLVGARVAIVDVLRSPSDAAMLSASLAELAAESGLRIGVLGFGTGALLAARLESPMAGRVLLYPGCDALDPPRRPVVEPVLLMHGEADPANGADSCTTAASRLARAGLAVRHRIYASAGYGWDHPAYGMEQRILVPRPDGAGRIPVAPWPELTSLAATHVAVFFNAAFAAGR